MIYKILEKLSVDRFQKFLDTGVFDSSRYSKTWDMLAWIEWNKNNNK